jgi:hypothetical protein
MNRDAFYKYRKRSVRRKTVEEKVVALVQNERKQQPRMGSRKLHFTLQEQFKSQDIKVARDRLINFLRDSKILYLLDFGTAGVVLLFSSVTGKMPCGFRMV